MSEDVKCSRNTVCVTPSQKKQIQEMFAQLQISDEHKYVVVGTVTDESATSVLHLIYDLIEYEGKQPLDLTRRIYILQQVYVLLYNLSQCELPERTTKIVNDSLAMALERLKKRQEEYQNTADEKVAADLASSLPSVPEFDPFPKVPTHNPVSRVESTDTLKDACKNCASGDYNWFTEDVTLMEAVNIIAKKYQSKMKQMSLDEFNIQFVNKFLEWCKYCKGTHPRYRTIKKAYERWLELHPIKVK